jgi:hypothetical protein
MRWNALNASMLVAALLCCGVALATQPANTGHGAARADKSGGPRRAQEGRTPSRTR